MNRLAVISIVVFLAVFIAITCEALDNKNRLLYFPCDEGSGEEVKDLSTNKFVGKITKGQWVKGVNNKALEFDGGSISVAPIGVNPDEFTIELWFKPAEKIEGGSRMDLMYRLNGGGRPHLTFNRSGVLFGFYFAKKGAGEDQVDVVGELPGGAI